jgi:hypothetical protein
MCVFCNRPKTQCSGWRSCSQAVYEAAKVNRQEWEQKEKERELRARTEPPNVVRTQGPTTEDGHLI